MVVADRTQGAHRVRLDARGLATAALVERGGLCPFPVRVVPTRRLDGLRCVTDRPGRLVAVNVAVVRSDPWTRVKSGRSGIDKRPVDGPVALLSYGVDGDTICDTANHGGPDQAVYAYSCDDLAFWAAELGQRMDPGGVGENLTLAGWTAPGRSSGSAGRSVPRCCGCGGRGSRAGCSPVSATCRI